MRNNLILSFSLMFNATSLSFSLCLWCLVSFSYQSFLNVDRCNRVKQHIKHSKTEVQVQYSEIFFFLLFSYLRKRFYIDVSIPAFFPFYQLSFYIYRLEHIHSVCISEKSIIEPYRVEDIMGGILKFFCTTLLIICTCVILKLDTWFLFYFIQFKSFKEE